ncbi:MAG: DUF748 domain-containing protein [Candidatus Accumulibacter sp.]|jgi:uncharacterized protein involved in outer membrane biogenesis|nr:DUF748 domain-containing protein [Accumulibacter sp.]
MKKFSLSPRKAKKYALWFFSGLLVFGVVCFFTLPPWIKSYATNEIAARIHRDVRIQKISVNPYALSLTIEGLEVGERNDESRREGGSGAKRDADGKLFFALDKLYLNIEVSSLFRNALVFNEVRLEKPRLAIVRLEGGRYNFSDLIENPGGGKAEVKEGKAGSGAGKEAEKEAGKEAGKGGENDARGAIPRFSLSNIRVIDGKIDFNDRPRKVTSTVDEINLALPFVSSIPQAVRVFDEPSLSARVDGSLFAFKGKSRLQIGSLESELALDFADLALPKYLAYLPVELPVKVKSGKLDGMLKVNFRQSDSTLEFSGNAALKELDLADAAGVELASAKRLDVSLDSVDPLRQKIQIGSVALDSPKINVQTSPSGALNWEALFSKKKTPSGKPEAPIEWSVAQTSVSNASLRWSDRRRAKPTVFTVDSLNAKLSKIDVSLASPVKVEASFDLGEKNEASQAPQASFSGSVVPSPLEAELKLGASRLNLAALQPLFDDALNLTLTRGRLNGSGVLSLRQPANAALKNTAVVFSGDVSAEDLRAVYKDNKSSALSLESLRLNRVDFRQNPDTFSVNEIDVSGFTARAVLAPNEKFSLFKLLRGDEPPPAAATAPTEEGAAPPERPRPASETRARTLRIGRIGVEKSSVFFSDHHVKPNYSTSLRNISGSVENLSSDARTRARLTLRGRYDNVVPFVVRAQLNPFSSTPYLDLAGEIKGVEMTQFSGYSGKYAGHSIQKGKLSITAQYQIEENQLTAENHIFIDQFDFGRAVESPDATTLPVTLFVSLLKNRNGEITVDLPVSGQTDDPHFSVGGLVFEAILNLLMKAVSSPFTLLTSMFGGGEEMSALEFDYGSATIKPETQKSIETLSKVFYERPGLKADLRGRVDQKRDAEGLKRILVDNKIRMAKRERMSEAEIRNIGAVEVSEAEYPDLLERVYRDGDFEKPRNFVGFTKTLPVEEMRKLLMENTRVGEEELRNLADRRARAVRDALVERGVSDERLFLLPSRLGRRQEDAASSGTSEGESEQESGQESGQDAGPAPTRERGSDASENAPTAPKLPNAPDAPNVSNASDASDASDAPKAPGAPKAPAEQAGRNRVDITLK